MNSKRGRSPGFRLFQVRLALLACFTAILAASANATTVIMPSDDQMIISSRAIVRARVISQFCGFDSRHDIVYTYVTLRIKEVIKGEINSREIVLKEPGGQTETLGSVFYGSPRFNNDESVILYLDTWPDGSLRVHNMFLGKFSVIRDPHSSSLMAVRDVPGPEVQMISLKAAGSGQAQATESTSLMELSAYLRLVRKKVTLNRAESRQYETRYYSGQDMMVQPPDYQDIARRAGPQPQFHLFYNARWFEPDSGTPVNFLVNPDGAPSAQISDDVSAALTAWSTVPACSLRLVNGGTTGACFTTGASVASFNNCLGFFSGGGCQNVLAEGGFNFNPGSTKLVNGITFIQIVEGYLSFNPFAACYFGDHCVVQEIATHEIGHTLGLAHSWEPSYGGQPTADEAAATMYYLIHADGRCASLRTDDINGITLIYPGTGSGGGGLPPSISTTTLPSGTVGIAYAANLAVNGGTAPFTWSLGSGSGPLPPGLVLNISGVIAGAPNTSGNFGFTIVVTDSAARTAQANLSILISDAGGGGGAVGGFNAHFVSQSVASSVQPGQSFQITITWNNIGTTSWTGGSVNLGSQNPANNTTWGTARLGFQPGLTIPPNVQAVMSFTATAPATPGVYQFQWQLVQDNGVGFFGDKSPNVGITVGTPGTGAPKVDTTTTPAAQLGIPYSAQLAASGGAAPYTWALSGGDFPPGLSLGLLSGAIAGTPTAAGNFSFTVQLTDAKSMTAQRSLVISVSSRPLSATVPPLPTAITGTAYSQQLSATGGLQPYVWSIASGSLPSGLKLDLATGVISGTPTVQGTFNFIASVSDSEPTKATSTVNTHILVVGPDAVPHIDSVKYKPGPQKLIINGQNFDGAAVAQVDGVTVTIKSKSQTQMVIKPLALVSGAHIITVTNPNGLPPGTMTLTVN